MKDLSEISKIGFGSYRISISNSIHAEALAMALNSGCNLVDTAPNYTFGESERLIGKVLNELNKDVFLITKAGYIQGDDIKGIQGLTLSHVAKMGSNFWYSLSPEFLDYQLKNSLKRLDRKFVDGFLLHNPEHYFSDKKLRLNKDKIYGLISRAFSYLEDKVKQGVIRYYGISSNTLPFHKDNPSTLSLPKLADLAQYVSTKNHFKLIQFPFNAIEDEASKIVHADGMSLIDTARHRRLVTLSNRPLNASKEGKMLRLATYDDEVRKLDELKSEEIFNSAFDSILLKLKENEMEDQWHEFPALVLLKDNWKNFSDPESVARVFHQDVYPFLNTLFDNSFTPREKKLLEALVDASVLFAKKKMTLQARMIEENLHSRGVLCSNPAHSLSLNLCEHYSRLGIDHVLVGMRKSSYVETFKDGFTKHNCLK